ncbi:hypothetical protein RRG08_022191 [Elysia crispata]|uniref:DDE Tnp4 domain-containing protein n=1 Tax=Elysia crispata TaxID=231223 RepID=A0AAE0YZ02_9GAST|nr:hypothetical protein RRG08_022191 [Elysia crispata]
MIGPHIEKRTTNFRKPLPATERLVITLRYLASEDTHQSQSFHFRAGISTVRSITAETCTVIWKILQPQVMPKPNEEHWLKIASEFFTRFQFPLCLGAIDGKHIRIKKPNKSGSKYYNYKHFFSIILLAVTDASGKFVVVDVGSCGGNSDGGVFSRSSLGKKLMSDKLSIPQRGYIPDVDSSVVKCLVCLGKAMGVASRRRARVNGLNFHEFDTSLASIVYSSWI